MSWQDVGVFILVATSVARGDDRPNIVWISCEDISPNLGCYGDPHAITPNLDRLAREGVRFERAFTPAGVCAVVRSGVITGMYPPAIGSQHMRSRIIPPPVAGEGGNHRRCAFQILFPSFAERQGGRGRN